MYACVCVNSESYSAIKLYVFIVLHTYILTTDTDSMANTNAIIHICMCVYKRSSTLVYQIHNYYTSTNIRTRTHHFTICALHAQHSTSLYDLHLFFAITYHPYLNTIKSFTYSLHFDVPFSNLLLLFDGRWWWWWWWWLLLLSPPPPSPPPLSASKFPTNL